MKALGPDKRAELDTMAGANPHTAGLERSAELVNELGLHARTAGMIARIARKAAGKVWLIKGGVSVDAADILDILTIACAKGSQIVFAVENPTDETILDEHIALTERGFEE